MDASVANSDDARKIDYLFQCYDKAHAELMLRIKSRDNWLKIQLLSQGVILALAQGVALEKASASDPQPIVLVIASFVAFVIACFYFVEDRLVSILSRYSASITGAESQLRPGKVILNSASSPHLEKHFSRRGALAVRLMGQIAAFILIPGLLLLLRMSSAPYQMLDFTVQVIEVSLDILLLATISVIAIFNFAHRAKAGKPPNTHNPDEIILLDKLPSE